jgi:hypothetical protein
MEQIRKTFQAAIEVKASERTVIGTITTGTCDRDGEIIQPSGVDTTEYQKNPVVLWQHRADLPPIARCAGLKRTATSIIATTVFADRPADHPADEEWLPDTVFSLFQQKVLNAFSVGFMPIAARYPNAHDLATYPECKRIFSQIKLLEYSVVTIPANSEAVATAVSKGLLTPKAARTLGFVLPAPVPKSVAFAIGETRDIEAEIAKASRHAFAKARGAIYADD